MPAYKKDMQMYGKYTEPSVIKLQTSEVRKVPGQSAIFALNRMVLYFTITISCIAVYTFLMLYRICIL